MKMKNKLMIIGLGAIIACGSPSESNTETSEVVETYYGEKINSIKNTELKFFNLFKIICDLKM